jgi:DNA damage-binding protein 1
MAYITPIHPPSGIKNALKLQLINPEEDVLTVARCNRIEIYTINLNAVDSESENVLDLVCSTRIFGRVTTLNIFRPADSLVDHLFVGTDLCNYFTMHWDQSSQGLVTTEGSEMSLMEANAQRAETERSTVDPSKEFLTLEVFEGIITTIPLARRQRKQVELGHLGKPAWARVEELNVRSSAFIQRPNPKVPPRLALLWVDHDDVARLEIREVSFSAGQPHGSDSSVEYKKLDDKKTVIQVEAEPLDFGASHLIPILEEPYGLLVLGETSISYFDDEEYQIKFRTALQKPTIWAAWERVDNQRYLLADIYGEVSYLMLDLDFQFRISKWKLDPLGMSSQATCLVYLQEGLFLIGSHQGDSQVAKIRPDDSLQVVQTIPNLGPILDFTVMDMGNRSEKSQDSDFSTGQARIVTGSGAWVDGSLRSVRSGVGLQDLGLLDDLEHVTHLFGLKLDQYSERKTDCILISFVDESRLYHFDDDGDVRELNEEEALGFILSEQTIHATNSPNGRALQVTSSTVQLNNLTSPNNVSGRWIPSSGGKITAISSTSHLAAVSTNGKTLTLLDLTKNLSMLSERSFTSEQISCIFLQPKVCFVGSWQASAITILDNCSLQVLQTITIDELNLVVPRAILVTKLSRHGQDTLMISMADGHVVTYDIHPTKYTVSNQKSTILGTRQADLQELPLENGVSAVFVASEHPSLIYDEDGQLAFSAVNTKEVNAICAFDKGNFPAYSSNGSRSSHCIAIASPKNVTFALIDSERTTQVQPLQVGQTVRRISYSPSLKAFGLGTIKRLVKDHQETTESAFKLVDEVLFKELDSYPLYTHELIEAVLYMKFEDNMGEVEDRFIIGTSLLDESTIEGIRGRIIVFEVTKDRKLAVSTQQSTKASCRSLVEVDGNIAAGFDKSVIIYSLDYTTGSTVYLKRRARTTIQTVVLDMAVEGNEIVVADMVKSIHVLNYKKNDPKYGGKDSLTEVARHFQTLWSTAVSVVAPHTYLVSDAENNLVVLQRNETGVTAVDRQKLQVISEFRLGELVNCIEPIDVKPSSATVVHPKAFIATVSTRNIVSLLN